MKNPSNHMREEFEENLLKHPETHLNKMKQMTASCNTT